MEDLSKYGFELSSTLQPTFNVLCVTKRCDTARVDFHCNVQGQAEVRIVTERSRSLTVAYTVVHFCGRDYELSHIRNGLNGTCLVIGIRNADDPRYDVWELYTDTPSSKPDRPGMITENTIRHAAEEASYKLQQARRNPGRGALSLTSSPLSIRGPDFFVGVSFLLSAFLPEKGRLPKPMITAQRGRASRS